MEQYEISAIMAAALPTLFSETRNSRLMSNINGIMKSVVIFTRRMLIKHDLNSVETCMALIYEIYKEGDRKIKTAIERVYIFSFSSLRKECSSQEWNDITNNMPRPLYNIYIKQLRSGKVAT
ncbi:MAG TPA: hypothetical protein VN040_22305 [Pseudosphingobacterium sp.]|nr:hypothetical protein [Pseudosphingobacterium sp.]